MMERELELPSWLPKALMSASAPPRGTLTKQQPPKIGDIYLVTPGQLGMGANRLCAVLELDSAMETARVALMTNETEYACDWDVRMSRDELQLPYELMVECDIVSSVWWTQLSIRVGFVPNAMWSGLLVAATTGDFSEVDESRRGAPIHGSSDPRWTFREHELSALQALSAECMSRLVDGLVLDPGLICVMAEASREEQVSIAAAISERSMIEMVTMDPGSLQLLFSAPDSLDADVWSALQTIVESASGAEVLSRSDQSSFEAPSLENSSPELCMASGIQEAFNSLLTTVLLGSRSIAHLLTRPEIWAANSAVLHFQSHDARSVMLVPEMLRS
jgi:hypothetical protein